MSIKRTASASPLTKRKISRSRSPRNPSTGIRDFPPRYFPNAKHGEARKIQELLSRHVHASSRLLVEKSSSLTTNIASKAFTRGRCLRIRVGTHVWVYNTWNKIWFIHVSVDAHAYCRTRARLFARVFAYDALYPRYRSCDRTIMQEMEEIYRSLKNERKITNLAKIGIK